MDSSDVDKNVQVSLDDTNEFFFLGNTCCEVSIYIVTGKTDNKYNKGC